MADPRLKTAVSGLLGEITALHAAGGGTLDPQSFASAVGLALDPAVRDALLQRGGIVFKSAGGAGGSFENTGAAMDVKADLATVKIPAAIRGTYECEGPRVRLEFEKSATLVAKKAFITAPLEAVTLAPDALNIDVGGALGGMLSRSVAL